MPAGGRGWARQGSLGCVRGSPWIGWSPRPPPCTHAWPAHPTQRTVGVPLRTVETTRVHHAQVTERIVVFDRVVRVETPQRRGDVARHTPARAGVLGESEASADAN